MAQRIRRNYINRELVDSIKEVISLGYFYIDGVEVYGSEREIGPANKESGVARGKLFVMTKVITNISDIPLAIDASLKKLQLTMQICTCHNRCR